MIEDAFKEVKYPGDWCLRVSNEGEEPYLLEKEFKGKNDRSVLDANFLDQAPEGYSSALSFFSDEAFHFYIPAYMICDLRDELENVEVYSQFTLGLEDLSRRQLVNPKRYGNRTWFDIATYKYSMFNPKEVKAVIAYLEFKKKKESLDSRKKEIQEALENYWYIRLKE